MQQRRIVRARDLASFREALVELALDGAPIEARRRAVLVPTRASAELLRETIEVAAGADAAGRGDPARPPDAVRVAGASARAPSPGRPRLLGRAEREVLLERAARATARRAQARRRAVSASAGTHRGHARVLRRTPAAPADACAAWPGPVRTAGRRARHGPRQRRPDPSDLLPRLQLPGLRTRRGRQRRLGRARAPASPAGGPADVAFYACRDRRRRPALGPAGTVAG